MNKRIKTKWIKALLSGKYTQTSGALCKEIEGGEKGYCCLGILTDLYIKEKKLKWENINGDIYFGDDGALLSDRVCNWSGIKDSRGLFKKRNNHTNCLSALNDKGKSFKEIAKVIQKYF